jgi:hypothetical protein
MGQSERVESAPAAVGVPSLTEVVARPELIDHLPVDVCETFIIQAATLQARLTTRIARAGAAAYNAGAELLDVNEAARLLGMAPDTLYRKVRRDHAYRSLTVDNGTDRVVFDPRKVKAFITRRVR